MSEEMIPDVEITSDVPERKSLAEIVKAFEELMQNEDRMQKSKEAEALKSAFYKMLSREKAEAQAKEDDADPWRRRDTAGTRSCVRRVPSRARGPGSSSSAS